MKKVLKMDNGYGKTYEFEIVNSIPKGYKIWNIGKNMVDGYLPICQVYPGTYSVVVETLKAIKFSEAQTILEAVGYGTDTVRKMEKYLEKHKNDNQSKRIKKALPLMKKLKWEK